MERGAPVLDAPVAESTPEDAPTAAPTPTEADALAPEPMPAEPAPDAQQTFVAKYDALEAPYDALTAHLNAMAFDGADWRAETVRLALAWRAAVDDLRRMPQPQGARWVEAWPVLMAQWTSTPMPRPRWKTPRR